MSLVLPFPRRGDKEKGASAYSICRIKVCQRQKILLEHRMFISVRIRDALLSYMLFKF